MLSNNNTAPLKSTTGEHPIMEDLQLLCKARHHDPDRVLGRHTDGNSETLRCLLPMAVSATLADSMVPLDRVADTTVFEICRPTGTLPMTPVVRWRDQNGKEHLYHDPYSYPVQLTDFDIHLFAEGRHRQAYQILGASPRCINGTEGILFATWAPNAERVSVVGGFNQWDGRSHPMRNRGSSGLWELFVPGMRSGELYKYEIRARNGGEILLKTDPYGRHFELRPGTAAVTTGTPEHVWNDHDWLRRRDESRSLDTPVSIYEIHAGSWRRKADGAFPGYRELAHDLVPYVKSLGFTHIELLPVTEHPLDASWGYQTTGFYAPTSRFGTPDDFRYFVDYCHEHELGVILDWVAGHFPKDSFGLARFDGTSLYEHADPRRGEHRDWGTLIFNYERNEVRNFLISNARYWIDEFHLDGLRVDAVASMLYLDYSREPDEWIPNRHGGNENLEAIDFLRELNHYLLEEFPGILMIAEESTAWPMVTRPSWTGGLGFSMKWNMGWMHDTLEYMKKDPVHRHFHHDSLTFGLLYAFNENFVLPISHDEVVHGKGSALAKMPGDDWQKFANLRLLYTYMFSYPGKKLLFMGNEFGQWREWAHDEELDWKLTDYPAHKGIQLLIGDLNRLYTRYGALHQHDFEASGFEWLDCHDASQSVLAYLRRTGDSFLMVILNFTPVPRHDYRLGVPSPGFYREVLNSDSNYYGGSNLGNAGNLATDDLQWMGRPYSLELTLPPLGGLILEYVPRL